MRTGKVVGSKRWERGSGLQRASVSGARPPAGKQQGRTADWGFGAIDFFVEGALCMAGHVGLGAAFRRSSRTCCFMFSTIRRRGRHPVLPPATCLPEGASSNHSHGTRHGCPAASAHCCITRPCVSRIALHVDRRTLRVQDGLARTRRIKRWLRHARKGRGGNIHTGWLAQERTAVFHAV